MIKVNLYVVGSLKEKYWQEAAAEYTKRISRFAKLNIIELAEENMDTVVKTVQKESSKILDKVKSAILLDINGENVTSEQLASKIQTMIQKGDEINFVIGGSNGVDDRVKNKFSSISFGKITYPHQLVRVVLLEQIYRAFTIINNIVYHK